MQLHLCVNIELLHKGSFSANFIVLNYAYNKEPEIQL